MIDLKLSSNHDLFFKNNRLVLVEGVNQKAQQIKIALMTFLGEWFLDTTIGLPYFEQILLKSADKVKIETIFRKKILAVAGVQRVLKLETYIDRQARILTVEFEAETDVGLVSDRAVIKEGVMHDS